MNIVDIIIIIWLLFGLIAGIKNGFTKQLISFVGFVVILFISYHLKNYVSVWMYEYLPFFKFGGIFKGVTVLNIALYELLAFIAVFAVLEIIFSIVMWVGDWIEKAMAFLVLPQAISGTLGAIVGVLEYYVIAFVLLYILALPVFDIKVVQDSELTDKILNNTPVLTSQISDTLSAIDEFAKLRDKYEVTGTSTEFNLETLDLFLRRGVITIDNVDMLVSKGKLQIDNIESVLSKYRTAANTTSTSTSTLSTN
jgi:uncharacterized membrane protein required for colicin V production